MTPIVATCLLGIVLAAADEVQTFRYLRLLPDQAVPECTLTLRRGKQGWDITSVTGRGATKMAVSARYDALHSLIHADASLGEGEQEKSVRVEVKEGQATISRDAGEVQEFAVPRGVIVTSAPDWTDTFLLCRHYDRKKGGKQAFPALWIHPGQPAQRLTFFIERVGADTIDHQSRKHTVDRHRIRIRNNSAYVAWTDSSGVMIKLMSLPVKGKGGTQLVREGYEMSAAALRPPASN